MGMKMKDKEMKGMNNKGMKMPMKKYKLVCHGSHRRYPITKLPMAKGVQSTMMAMDPKYRLEDPGVGLRKNGRRVLTYADLKEPLLYT